MSASGSSGFRFHYAYRFSNNSPRPSFWLYVGFKILNHFALYADNCHKGCKACMYLSPLPSAADPNRALLSAAIRRRRQGIGAAALACVGTARRLTGKAVGACATVLRGRTCHDCGLSARVGVAHGGHRSMGIGEAKEQQTDPDHLWASPFVSSSGR